MAQELATVLVAGAASTGTLVPPTLAAGTAHSSFAGTIISPMAVTLGNLGTVDSRVLAGGTVTLANSTIEGP